jgi:hypothetical protein
MTWFEADAFLLLQQVDDVLLLVDVAGGDVSGFSMTYLLETVPEMTTSFPLPMTAIARREQLLDVRDERRQVAAHLDLEGLDRPRAVPYETGNRPGCLP